MSEYCISNAEIKELWSKAGKYKEFQRLCQQIYGRTPGLGTVFRWLRRAGIEPRSGASVELVKGEVLAPDETRLSLEGRTFVFTCAQNNTEVHEEFLSSLETYCAFNNAKLVVGKTKYGKEDFWDDRVKPYLMCESASLAPDLVWCGELNIIPTTVSPLAGLDSYARGCTGIVPHTQVHMLSCPRHPSDKPRFMYSTGAVTRRNYIQRKAGQRASFHHVFGALVVELTQNGWFIRQLIADNDGTFYDLDKKYYPGGRIEMGISPEAINLGDLHLGGVEDNQVTVGIMDMLNSLTPKNLIVHDSIDFRCRNHHNLGDPYHMYSMYFHGTDSVNEELGKVAGVLQRLKFMCKKVTRDTASSEVDVRDANLVVVASNHDNALARWLREADFRKDPANAKTFLRLQLMAYSAVEKGEPAESVFALEMKSRGVVGTFLQEGDSYRICPEAGGGIECGMHGHQGINGSRGTPRQFSRLGVKCNTGHTHSAGIVHGVYTAGVSCPLNMGYNTGPTSWSHSHIITYSNGKRTIITQRGRRWRGSIWG